MNEKLNTMTLPELRLLAKKQEVPNYSRMKKQELIDALSEADVKVAEPEVHEAPVKETPVKTEEKPSFTRRPEPGFHSNPQNDSPIKNKSDLDSGIRAAGVLDILPDGFGFLRAAGYASGEGDVYVANSQIKRFNLKQGDYITGTKRISMPGEKYDALLYVQEINGVECNRFVRGERFENLTPVFPHERLRLEYPGCDTSMRILDLIAPIGKGQRGMIVAQPKVGKTTLLKQIANSLIRRTEELQIIILLIDERPEEVTDMQDTFRNTNIEIAYSTFDETPEHHRKVTEMVLERAKRMVESKKDVVILTDSLTRMTRAYNLTCTPSGRTLSGGLDPAGLYMPKKFFGSARCMKEGGSLTILATALQETGSRLDDMVYEEFKGTGNMELVLSRKLSERRIFPAIDILKSSTRRDDLLLDPLERDCLALLHRVMSNEKSADKNIETILDLFSETKTNREFMEMVPSVQWD